MPQQQDKPRICPYCILSKHLACQHTSDPEDIDAFLEELLDEDYDGSTRVQVIVYWFYWACIL